MITSLVSLVSGAITDMAFRLARSASSCNSERERGENVFPLASPRRVIESTFVVSSDTIREQIMRVRRLHRLHIEVMRLEKGSPEIFVSHVTSGHILFIFLSN